MFINGKSLLEANPIHDMVGEKVRYKGTSYGLSEGGYDIRIAETVHFFRDSPVLCRVSVAKPNGITQSKPGNFTLASAKESFHMPNNLIGFVKDKSTWARQGLSVFNTVIEPGWNGFLTLELVFHGNDDLTIPAGCGIAQVCFGLLAHDASYGNGKYQNQEAGAQGHRS
jgi:dCTP deaminase